MRIGIDARYAFYRNRRGIGNYIRRFLEEYVHLAPDMRFVLYLDRTAGIPSPTEFPPDRFAVRVLPHAPMAVWEQAGLPRAAAQDAIDLLHCPANVAPLASPVPVLLTVHDVIEWQRGAFGDYSLPLRHRISRAYRMPVMRRNARTAAGILTVSEFSKCDIAAQFSVAPEKIQVTPLGPSPHLVSAGPGDRSMLPETPYVLAVGALDRRKNTEVLIRVFRQLHEQGRIPAELRLVVVGVERVDVFAHLGGDSVQVLPFVSDDQLKALYHGAMFFVFPSLYEGFGIPVLDALACGTPVVCSRSSSLPEVSGHAALYFDPVDAADMARQIEQMAGDAALRQALAAAGRMRASQFSWGRLAEATISVYREILKGGAFHG